MIRARNLADIIMENASSKMESFANIGTIYNGSAPVRKLEDTIGYRHRK